MTYQSSLRLYRLQEVIDILDREIAILNQDIQTVQYPSSKNVLINMRDAKTIKLERVKLMLTAYMQDKKNDYQKEFEI